MNWTETNQGLPPETGRYLVSMERPSLRGTLAFLYVAHYEADEKKWYQYDPFSDLYKPTNVVEGNVVAWTNDAAVFINGLTPAF
jgi:hypothetical protein